MPVKFVLGVACLLCSSLHAQTIRPLQLNETIPAVQYTYAFNDTIDTARLPDNTHQLTILDFWATWCSSCVAALPKLEKLQQEFENRLRVVLVNTKNSGDDTVKVNRFFKKWEERTGKPLRLRSVVNDSILDALFPHNLIPHYVWINSAGTVIAATSAGQVTAANINAVLNGAVAAFPMKKDQDRERPLFTSTDLPAGQMLRYSILLKGRFDGLGSGNRLYRTGDTLHGHAITNTPLAEMYETMARKMFTGFTSNKLILDVKDPGALIAPPPGEERDKWNRMNMYSLDVIVPVNQSDSLYAYMLQELNRYSGYHGQMEKRKLPCMILISTGKNQGYKTLGGEKEIRLYSEHQPSIKNEEMRHLVTRLNNCPAIGLPIVNETGYTGNIDMNFPDGFTDIKKIRQRLQQSGLDLQKAERTIEVFVIKDK
ncbi:MAG TPA: TlpA disulfide reductase family protein [Agriterribacter sp.]|nr:TlpA disulfide reductase family protein [Agriterribacter sp.]